MAAKHVLNEELAELVAGVLRSKPEDWGDVDARVLYARILRLEAQLEALERHHRSVHPRCGELGVARQPRPAETGTQLRLVDQRRAA